MIRLIFRCPTLVAIAFVVGFLFANSLIAMDQAGSGSRPVLRLVRHMGLAKSADPGPRVLVWGDGSVDIHYPAYMRQAGDYRLELDRFEFEQLLRDVVADGLLEFDGVAVREAMAQRQSVEKQAPGNADGLPGGVVSRELDRGFSQIEFSLPGADGIVREGSVSWTGLQSSARQWPDVEDLQGLARVERRLLDLAHDPKLLRIPE